MYIVGTIQYTESDCNEYVCIVLCTTESIMSGCRDGTLDIVQLHVRGGGIRLNISGYT